MARKLKKDLINFLIQLFVYAFLFCCGVFMLWVALSLINIAGNEVLL